MTVDMTKLTSLSDLAGEDADETKELQDLGVRARDFVASFHWCGGVTEIYSGIAVPGVVGVFFVRILPRGDDVDPELWVIVGDIPPAYVVTDDASTPAEALMVYADLMQEWVKAVNDGRSVRDLVPVNADPTREAASMLDARLRFLVERIVPEYSDDAKLE